MEVTVRLIGSLRVFSSKSKIALKLGKTAKLREAIDKLIEKQPRLQRALIDPELNDPRTNVITLVNGKEISVLNGLETTLKDGDTLILVPVVHGG